MSQQEKNIQKSQHDYAYKGLFKHRETVISFIRMAMDKAIYNSLDFSDMHEISPQLFKGDGALVFDDTVWKIKYRETYCFTFAIFEFQSSNDRLMALRLLRYTVELWSKLYETGEIAVGDPLPLIIPMVIYNGVGNWTACKSITEMQQNIPKEWKKFQPQFKYILIDIQRSVLKKRNLKKLAELPEDIASLVIRMERAQFYNDIEELFRILLEFPQELGLTKSVVQFFNYVLTKHSDYTLEQLESKTLKENYNMVLTDDFKYNDMEGQLRFAEGEKKGMKKGRVEGLLEGALKKSAELVGNLMKNTGESIETVFKLLSIPDDQRPAVRKMLQL